MSFKRATKIPHLPKSGAPERKLNLMLINGRVILSDGKPSQIQYDAATGLYVARCACEEYWNTGWSIATRAVRLAAPNVVARTVRIYIDPPTFERSAFARKLAAKEEMRLAIDKRARAEGERGGEEGGAWYLSATATQRAEDDARCRAADYPAYNGRSQPLSKPKPDLKIAAAAGLLLNSCFSFLE